MKRNFHRLAFHIISFCFLAYLLCGCHKNMSSKISLKINGNADSLTIIRIQGIENTINKEIVYMDANRYVKKLLSQNYSAYYCNESITLINLDKQQYCTLQITPGNSKSDFSYFKVGYVSDLDSECSKKFPTKFREFTSGSGISLGISKNDFFSIKDSQLFESTSHSSGYKIYFYKVYDSLGQYDKILKDKYFNLPYYTNIFKFDRQEKLIEFGFGLTPSASGIYE